MQQLNELANNHSEGCLGEHTFVEIQANCIVGLDAVAEEAFHEAVCTERFFDIALN